MDILKHVVESIFKGPRVLIQDCSSKDGHGQPVAVWYFGANERLSSRLSVVSKDSVLIFGDDDEFDLKKPYAITLVKGGKVTTFKPAYAVWRDANRQVDRLKRARSKKGSDYGSSFLFSTHPKQVGNDFAKLAGAFRGSANLASGSSDEDALALFEALAKKSH